LKTANSVLIYKYLKKMSKYRGFEYKIPIYKSQITNKFQHAAQAPALRVTKIQNLKRFGRWILLSGIYPSAKLRVVSLSNHL